MKKTLCCLLFGFHLVDICYSCLNITPHNVNFSATNFKYMLQWSKDRLPLEVSFSVQFMRYGHDQWLIIPQCENISDTSCNLMDSIIGDEEDFMENEYYGRVRALYKNCSSKWVMSKRLNPREDNYLVLPKVNYTEHVRSITIIVLTPSVNNKSVEELYKDKTFEYHLSFLSPEKQEAWPFIQRDRKFEISGLNPNTEYNGSAYIMIGDKRKSNIQFFVVKTLPDLSLVALISILATVLVAMPCAVLLFFCCKYVKQPSKTPASLDFQKRRSIQLMSLPVVKCSCFSPAMILQLYDPHLFQDQSRSEEPISYAGQLQTSALLKTFGMPTQTSNYKQQNNCNIAPKVHYGGLFEENTEHQINLSSNVINKTSYNPQMELNENVNQSLLNEKGETWIENTGGGFHVFPLQEPSNALNLNSSLGLMSTLVVSGMSEFMEQEEHTEQPPVLLSNLNIAVSADNSTDNDAFQNVGQQYIRQNPHISVMDGTCEQPYRLQHFPHNLPMTHSS